MRGRGKDRGRGRWGQGPGRGLRRLLEPVLLLRLHEGQAHGYSLLDGLDEYGLGDLDPSVIYRFLREMESAGWVSSTWDSESTQGPPRRIYQITEAGQTGLSEWAKELRSSKERIERFLEVYDRRASHGKQ